ncbi:helix-turn-helix transcriptional regulator [Streptomyces fractus]|uniref:helix-turn-helix transcriptional regulator n=1 Tax=Streptomyces fractus TaxID=641806 RepID=UPI003CF0E7DE
MGTKSDIRDFLVSRRGKIRPQEAGLPVYGGSRRVPGLRREEVAMLAGVSVDYYGRLERGDLNGVSDSVLDALARALRLDEAERSHLYDLARAANTTPRARSRSRLPAPQEIRPSVQYLLDSMPTTPAVVITGRLDVLATNRLGKALYAPLDDAPELGANLARLCFLDPRGTDFYPDWDATADTAAAILRTESGRTPDDEKLTDLVKELSTGSEEFRARWDAHDVNLHRNGVKRFCHPQVGGLDLLFEALPLPADPGLTLVVYTAEPGTAAHDGLARLATWAASEHLHDRDRRP